MRLVFLLQAKEADYITFYPSSFQNIKGEHNVISTLFATGNHSLGI